MIGFQVADDMIHLCFGTEIDISRNCPQGGAVGGYGGGYGGAGRGAGGACLF